MTEESVNLQIDSINLEHYLEILCLKLEALQDSVKKNKHYYKHQVNSEIRTLDFWKSVLSECLASFFYVLLVCGALTGTSPGVTSSNITMISAFASGFSIIMLTQCFGNISGAFINPAITLSALITKNLSLIRAFVYIIAQCGGGIAGAALLYGISVIGYQNNLLHSSYLLNMNAWERFGLEFTLTFILALTFLISRFFHKKLFDISPLTIGSAYATCTFVSMPHMNPARSLGPSFVLNRWDMHWVYWFGPILGGFVAGIIFEFIYNHQCNFNEYIIKNNGMEVVGDCSSINSDEEDTYDDLENKAIHLKMNGGNVCTNRGNSVNSFRPILQNNRSSNGYCSNSLYSNSKLEPIYDGSKSMYCKSPPLTRANLNRSQSVYTKSNNAINKDTLSRSGHLLPAQSMYPIRFTTNYNQQNYANCNQNSENMLYNMQNTLPTRVVNNSDFLTNKCDENRTGSIYGLSINRNQTNLSSDDSKFTPTYFNSASRFNSMKNNCRNNPY